MSVKNNERTHEIDWVIDGEHTRGWLHTHGLCEHGLPELEVRNIPAFLAEAAARLLNDVADYMLKSGNTVRVGETMSLSKRTRFRLVKADPIPGSENHYAVERWQLVELDAVPCECCAGNLPGRCEH